MSSSRTLAGEISLRLQNSTTQLVIRDGNLERTATLQDLREYLAPMGLDITTKDAVDWNSEYPGCADTAIRICDLQRQVDDLTQARSKKLTDASGEVTPEGSVGMCREIS